MTDEEIIKKYDEVILDLHGDLLRDNLNSAQENYIKESLELFKAGRNALREKEKVPCEYCGAPSPSSDCVLHDGTELILCSRDGLFGDCYIMHRKICFCPMCGKPLKGD